MSNFSTNYTPQYTPPEEQDFFSYYDDLKYEKFMQDPDNSLKKTKIINFDLIHNQCRGDKLDNSQQYYQTVFEENLATYKKQDKQKFVGSALRNQKEVDILVERKIVSEHFTNHVKKIVVVIVLLRWLSEEKIHKAYSIDKLNCVNFLLQ